MKNGLFIIDAVIDTILLGAKGDRAKIGEAFEAIIDYARTGNVRTDIGDLTKVALINAKHSIDVFNARSEAGAKSHGGGAPKGNQNARKYYKTASERNKGEKTTTTPRNSLNNNELQTKQQQNNNKTTTSVDLEGEKTTKNNSKTTTPNFHPCNALNNSELQQKQQQNNNDININIDIDRLNTSPLTELVLSQEKEKEKELEPALAPLNGGAVSNSFSNSFSENRLEEIGDGKATPAPCNGGASLPTSPNEKNWNDTSSIPRTTDENAGEKVAIPQTSSANSHSLQTPPTPSPPATPQRTVGFVGNTPMSEEAYAEYDREIKENIKNQKPFDEGAISQKVRGGLDYEYTPEEEYERDKRQLGFFKELLKAEEDSDQKVQLTDEINKITKKTNAYETQKR